MHKRLLTVLTVCGLIFALGGCHSEPNGEELKQQELRELEARIPPYYLTAAEVGAGYQFYSDSDYGIGSSMCVQRSMPLPVKGGTLWHVTYMIPETKRQVIVSAVRQINWELYGDFLERLSDNLENRCGYERWDGEEGKEDWLVWESSRVEGLSHGAFGFRSTQWGGFTTSVPYPPTQHQLDTDTSLLWGSSSRAYGRIGDYLVTVSINDNTIEPPSEDELKDLWDKQVHKLEQYLDQGNG